MEFTQRAIALMTSGVLNLLLAGFIFWQYRKRRIARIFAVTSFLVFFYCWLVGGLAAVKTPERAFMWIRIFVPFVYFLMPASFLFSMVYSKTENTFTRAYLYVSYAFATMLSLAKLLNIFPAGVEYREGQGWFPAEDIVYFKIYTPFMFLTIILGLALVISRLIKSRSATEKNQMRFFLVAVGGAIGISNTNLVPSISFMGAFAPFIYSAILAFAITRHRIFDLSLVLQKGVVAAGFAFCGTALVVMLLLKVQDYVVIRDNGFNAFAIVSTALFLCLMFIPVWNVSFKYSNRWLGVKNLNPTERLLEFSSMQAKFARFEDYLGALLRKLNDEMGLSHSNLYFRDAMTDRFMSWAAHPSGISQAQALATGSALLRAMKNGAGGLDAEELISPLEEGDEGTIGGQKRRDLLDEFAELNAQVAFPIMSAGRLEGILILGSKSSGSLFSQSDHVFLAALCGRIAGAWENARLFEKIQQAERLSVVGTLAASLAHEIRNPLAAISNFVQMLPERHAEPMFRDQFMATVVREVEKLTDLTNQLLAFGRPSQGMRVQVGMNALAERANHLVRFQFLKKGVGLAILPCPDREIFTLGDESQLSQVALNLLLNALQATQEGGMVTLLISRPAPEWAEVKVTDTGIGMSPAQASRVFDAFFTTKSTGTGLGLAICRRVVTEHGGEIKLKSEEGKGTTFTVMLPAAENGRLVADQVKNT